MSVHNLFILEKLCTFMSNPFLKSMEDWKPKEGYGAIYLYIFDNGKKYVGLTRRSIYDRYMSHIHSKLMVDHALKSHCHEVKLLSVVPIEQLAEEESKFVKIYDTEYPNGYNLTSGGDICYELSDESRRKISEGKLGEKNPMYGKRNPYLPDIQKLAVEKLKRPVKNLKTEEIYSSVSDASRECGVSLTSILKSCMGRCDTGGGDEWVYVDDPIQHEFGMMARAVSKYYNKIETDMKYHDERAELCRELSKTNIGRKKTEEQRKKISEANKGRKLSEEAKQKISESKKGRPGVRHSEETKEKLSKMMMGERNPQFGKRGKDAIASKEVIAFEYPSMKELKRFDSQAEASEYYNIPFQSVSYSCTKRTIYKDLMIGFKFADDVDYKVKQTITVVGKFDMQDNLLDTFNSYAEAAESIGVTLSAIRSCCTGRTKQCQGFKWKRLN